MKILNKKRTAVSPVIATLLLIAIAVAAAIIVYAFVTGLIGGLSTGAGSSLVTITGGLSVPTGSGSGTLVMSLKNGASNPVTGITLTSLTNGANNFYQVAHDGAFTFSTGAGPVAVATPLAVGSTASAALSYSPFVDTPNGFTSGSVYTALVTVTFANGSTQTYTYSITAQL